MEVSIRKITPIKLVFAILTLIVTTTVPLYLAYLDYQRKINESNATAVQKLEAEDMVNKQQYLSDLAEKIAKEENDVYYYYDNINKSIENDPTAYKTIKFYLIQLESIVIDRKDELCKIDDESDDWCQRFLWQGRRVYSSFHPFVCRQRHKYDDPQLWKNLEEYLFRGLGIDMELISMKKRCDAYNKG